MGVAPDFGTKIDSGEDSGGIDPNVVEDMGAKWGDEGKGVSIKVWDAGDVTEEVSLDEFLLGDPKFLAAVVDNSVLVRVTVDGEGAGRGGEEIGEDFR